MLRLDLALGWWPVDRAHSTHCTNRLVMDALSLLWIRPHLLSSLVPSSGSHHAPVLVWSCAVWLRTLDLGLLHGGVDRVTLGLSISPDSSLVDWALGPGVDGWVAGGVDGPGARVAGHSSRVRLVWDVFTGSPDDVLSLLLLDLLNLSPSVAFDADDVALESFKLVSEHLEASVDSFPLIMLLGELLIE